MAKALGIVRKIDDLGRIVIPKEIRKVNGWKSGTPMEMFATENGLMIREYATDMDKLELLADLNEVYKQTDNDAVFEIIERTIKFLNKQ